MNCRKFDITNSEDGYIYTFFVDKNDDRKIVVQLPRSQDSDETQTVSYIDDEKRNTLLRLHNNVIENAKLSGDTEKEDRLKNDRKCLEELFKKYKF